MDLEPLVRPVVEASGLELIDVTFGRESGRRLLRVTVDREGGVDLDTIAATSERISRRLDVEGFDPGPYALEVSSPGVERPLRSIEEFARRLGEKVRVKTYRPVDGARTHVGTIASVTRSTVTLDMEHGQREIAADGISSARTVFEWGQTSKARSKR